MGHLKLTTEQQLYFANAILRLDEFEARKWMRVSGFDSAVSERHGDAFTAVIHSARILLVNATQQQRRESEEWLRARAFEVPKPYLKD